MVKCSSGLFFRQYKVHLDIRRGSVARRLQTKVGWLKTKIMSTLTGHISGESLVLKPTLLCSVILCSVTFQEL